MTNDSSNDKPMLLNAIESFLANPQDIQKATQSQHERYKTKYCNMKSDEDIADIVAKKIISNYSYYTACVGGATGLTGVIPGLGTLIAVSGGAMADAAISMKWQIEMTMAIASVYGHDITTEEKKNLCFLVAGLGTVAQGAKEGGKAASSKAFIAMVQSNLKGPLLHAIKELFKKIGITFTRKAVEKAIPFGIGIIVGAGMNKALTCYVGGKAMDFFKVAEK